MEQYFHVDISFEQTLIIFYKQIASMQSEWCKIEDVNQRSYFITKFEGEKARIIPLSDIKSVYSIQSKDLHNYFIPLSKL